MFSDLITSIVRTAVPALISAIVSFLTVYNIKVPDSVLEWLSSALFFGFAFVYYTIVRLLESKYPKLGWLLGVPVKPTYASNQ